MNLSSITEEVKQQRFSAADPARIENWVRSAYTHVWSYADWSFKRVGPTDFPVVATNTDLPSDASRVLVLTDPIGEEPLPFIEAGDFDRNFPSIGDSPGSPEWFTVYNRQVVVAPPPNGDYTLHLSYQRRLSHRDNVGAVVGGHMSAGDDQPIWDEEHHDVLVTGGLVVGLKRVNDPTWPPLQDEFERQLRDMLDDLRDPGPGPLQYGRDTLS